jgi:hypothetical protein
MRWLNCRGAGFRRSITHALPLAALPGSQMDPVVAKTFRSPRQVWLDFLHHYEVGKVLCEVQESDQAVGPYLRVSRRWEQTTVRQMQALAVFGILPPSR